MKITEVKIEIVKPNEGLIGFASIVIDGSIYLSSIAIYKKLNAERYRLLYPKKGVFDIYYPISKEASSLIEQAIFNKLSDVMSKVYDRYNSYKIPFNKASIVDYRQFGSQEEIANLLSAFVYKNSKPRILPNNPKAEHNKLGYFPRITLVKSYYKIDGNPIFYKIECSIPKILFENNVYEYSNKNFHLFLWILQDKLWRMGLWIELEDLENAFVSRIDFSKNILLPNNCYSFIRYVNKIPLDARLDKADINYSNKGYCSKQHSDDYQISLYDKGLEYNQGLYSGQERYLQNCSHNKVIDCRIRHKKLNIIRFEISFFNKRKLRELCENLKIDAGEYRLYNLLNTDVAKTILQHYASKITISIRKLNLDSVDEMAMLDRIQKAYPNAENNKILRLFSQNILLSKYGTELFQHKFGYKSDELCKLRKDLEKINSSENLPFSSIMQNIHAVEDCLEEFSPLEESNFFEG